MWREWRQKRQDIGKRYKDYDVESSKFDINEIFMEIY